MPAAGRRATTAGKHIQQHHPLPKGEACVSCKARKVRCDAGTPACGSCMRTARFEGRDPELVVCQYNGRRCSAKGSPAGGRKGKGKASSVRSSRTQSPQIQRVEETELDRILAANLGALLPALPSYSSSPSSSSCTSFDSIFSRGSSTSSSTSTTSTCPPSPPLQAYALWPNHPPTTCDSPLEANFDWTQLPQAFINPSLYAYSYPTDPSAAAYLAAPYLHPSTTTYPPQFFPSSPTDSLSDEQILCPPSPPFAPYGDLPAEFSNTAHDAMLSLPMFPLQLPPHLERNGWGGWEAGDRWGVAS